MVADSDMAREEDFPRRSIAKAPERGNGRPEDSYVGKKEESRDGSQVLEELE